jgi:hypothetical protein
MHTYKKKSSTFFSLKSMKKMAVCPAKKGRKRGKITDDDRPKKNRN